VTTGLGSHNIPIPPMASFIGAAATLQGGRVEAGPTAIVLLNALDLTIGI
jgi:hypothetical protein